MGFSTDDYLFIQQLAPIRTFADVLRPFWHIDPNPPYWRPLADASAAFDFLIWGWSGQGFHLTNFILHLAATALVYPFSRRVLRLSTSVAAITTFAFGIAASHESNLLWPAARADILVTIFAILMLIAHEYAIYEKKGIYLFYGCTSFILALLSKENGLLALPLLVVLIELPLLIEKRASWRSSIFRIVPYGMILVIFWIIRTHFTIPIDQTEPLLSEGSRSVVAFLRNAIYGIGYALIPLDLEQATEVLRQQTPWMWAAISLLGSCLLLLWLRLPRQGRGAYLRPVLFFAISGIVAMQSFERWRYYMPSAGLFAITALFTTNVFRNFKYKTLQTGIIIVALVLVFFHVWRARSAERNWEIAADEVQQLKAGLKTVLNAHPARPLKLDLIDVPAKLGSASIMMVGFPEFVRQAEAERLKLPGLPYGDESETDVQVEKAIDVYALDRAEGFSQIQWKRSSDSSITLRADPSCRVYFEPTLLKIHGVSRRDWKLNNGDVFEIGTNRIMILEADGSFARAVNIDFIHSRINASGINDSSWLPVIFDGRTFRDIP